MPPGDRIGDAHREHWLSFLRAAYEDGYLTEEEFSERMEKMLAAKRRRDIDRIVAEDGLPFEEWREAGKLKIKPPAPPKGAVLPAPAAFPEWSRSDDIWVTVGVTFTFVLTLGGWLMFALTIAGVI